MTDKPGRTLELEVAIDASLDDVWRALTDGELIRRWFAPEVSATPGAGGSQRYSWGPGEEWAVEITAWEPNARVRFESDMPSPSGGPAVRLAVEYQLSTRAGRSVVRLVQSGFAGEGWDDFLDGTEAGWAYFLENLRHSVERHPGVPRELVRLRVPLRGSLEEVRRAVFGPQGFDLSFERLAPGAAGQLQLGGRRQPASVRVARLPRTLGLLLPELNDALLLVEREGLDDEFRLGVWLSTYGLPPGEAGRLQESLDQLGERLQRALPRAATGRPE